MWQYLPPEVSVLGPPGWPPLTAGPLQMPIVEITRCEEFSASHRLHNPALSDEENRKLYGPCNNLNGHGHNYDLFVTVCGEIPVQTGMVMNLHDLMWILREKILPQVDHKHLNHDVPFLQGVIPTAENIAVSLWNQIEPEIERFEGCRLHKIRLCESRNNIVEYRGSKS